MFSKLRGRAGYAADRVLFYGTAGRALANMQTVFGGVTTTHDQAGWTAAAGMPIADIAASFDDLLATKIGKAVRKIEPRGLAGMPKAQSRGWLEALGRSAGHLLIDDAKMPSSGRILH